jgi:hypothetical protein
MADEDTYPLGYWDDEDDGPWCRDFDGHKASHEFCEDHQIAWCRICSRMCSECIDDPRCPDCGCSLFTEEHDWDCGYEDDCE